MAAAVQDTDGDRVIEVVSVGALYRGEEWERKYWSCSRGRDRYPYPVGYHTVRHFFGISYTMEIKEGPRGPSFLVTSSEGDSATGPTPDLAWKNFQKKSGPKVRNWQRRRSFPQKIDGAELFGFKNASVQRLLRELIVYATGLQKLPCPVTADAASPSSNKDTTDISDVESMPVCFNKTNRTGKRIMKPNLMESTAKRVQYQDPFPSVATSGESAHGNANEGNVSDSRCGGVPDNLKCTSVADSLGEPSQSSSQQVDLSSGSYLSSEKSDLESAEKEAARFMLSFLLPQAIPFLKKNKKKKKKMKKKSKQKGNDIFTGSLRTVSAHKPSDDCWKGTTVPTTADKGTNINGSETYLHGGSLCNVDRNGGANDDCTKVECVVKLHGMKDVIEDSFEEDVHIWGDNTFKSKGVHRRMSDDACSREPNEHPKDEFEVKLDEMKDVVEDSLEEDAHIWGDNASKSRGVHHRMSDDACSREPNERSKNEFEVKLDEIKDVVEDSFEEDAHIPGVDSTSKSRGIHHPMSDDACSRQRNEHYKDESASKLNKIKVVVEDSFEEDAHIWGDNTSKSRGALHYMSDDACSRQPNEHSKDDSVAKSHEVKDVEENLEDAHIWGDDTSKPRGVRHHISDDACSRQPNEYSKDDSVAKLDEMKDVEDSFEEGAHILGDNTSKSQSVRHHVSDDICSRESDKKSKVLDGAIKGHIEPFEYQVVVHDGTKTPDVVYDHEKGKYVLSDSFLAFLEEEFGGDECPYPENYNQCNNMSENMQFEQQFKDPTDGMKDGSISLDVSCRKNIDNGLVDVCAQAQCRYDNENTMLSVGCESNVCDQISPKVEHSVSHHQHDHAFSSGSDHQLELMGCYLHPRPVLSIMLNTKNHSNLHFCVLCGFLKSFQRFLYIYTITPKDQRDAPPHFVGYTPLLLPSLEQSSTGNYTFGRSGLQLTSDGQFVVLMSSIGIPFCRMGNIDCSCCVCKSHRFEDNSLKIVSVNFGYVSLITKLMPYGTVSCILLCEPNYVIAAENSRNLHIWKMVTGWSKTSEDYVIPSLGHAGPSILELRRMSRNNSLIIGHDGAGGFCLWDITRRTLLATFAAPGNIIFQILPVSFCSLKDMIHVPVDDIEKRLQEVPVSDMSTKVDQGSFLMAQREDIAVWALVSSASVAEYQHDLRAKKHNARWRLALLANKRIFMGNILDSRVTAVDTSGNYGFAGTYGGLLYMWELSSGRKLAGTQCINGERVSCIAVDAESGAVAVADDGCRLLLYTRKVLSDAGGR